MKTILITGSNGLIGKRLVEILKPNYEIIEINRKKSKFLNLIGRFKKIDIIIHLASNCMIRDIIKTPSLSFDNVRNTFDVFELARKNGCKKIVYFSSGRISGSKFNPYTISKIYGEELSKAYKDCYNIDYLIVRPDTVWGINEKKPRIIPLWIKNAQTNKDIIIYGDKNKTLPPIHVNDFTTIFLQMFNKFIDNNLNNKTILISGIPIKAVEIAKIIKNQTKSKSKIIFKDVETGQPQQYAKCYNQLISKIPFKIALRNALKK